MRASDAVRIKFIQICRKFQLLKNPSVWTVGWLTWISLKEKEEEAAFEKWVKRRSCPERKIREVLNLLREGYTSTDKYKEFSTYLSESFSEWCGNYPPGSYGTKCDVKGSTPDEINIFLEDRIQPFFKDYEPELGPEKYYQPCCALPGERVPAEFPTGYISNDR